VPDEGRVEGDAARRQLLEVTRLTPGAGGEAEGVVGGLAEEPDALVTEVEEVAGGHAPADEVVGGHRADVGAGDVDEHDGHAARRQPVERAGGRWEGHDQQAVGAVPPEEVGEALVTALRRLDVEQDEVVRAVGEDVDDAAEPLDGGGVGEEGNHDAEAVAPPERQPTGERAGSVVEHLDRRQDPLAGPVADLRAVVQHPGDGGRAHAGMSCHIADRDHGPPL
jgi:hypothetical protein